MEEEKKVYVATVVYRHTPAILEVANEGPHAIVGSVLDMVLDPSFDEEVESVTITKRDRF